MTTARKRRMKNGMENGKTGHRMKKTPSGDEWQIRYPGHSRVRYRENQR